MRDEGAIRLHDHAGSDAATEAERAATGQEVRERDALDAQYADLLAARNVAANR